MAGNVAMYREAVDVMANTPDVRLVTVLEVEVPAEAAAAAGLWQSRTREMLEIESLKARGMNPNGKRESQSNSSLRAVINTDEYFRISPTASRSPTPAPPPPSTTISTRNPTPPPVQSAQIRSGAPPAIRNDEPEMELELETEATSKPVEETIAERRARRQAIRAKYGGVASTAMSANERASQSPGPSSAVSQPPPSTSEANLTPKDSSAIPLVTPHLSDHKVAKYLDEGMW